MNIPHQIIKQIIRDEIDLKSFDERDKRQWITAGLIDALNENGIFPTAVRSISLKMPSYAFLCKVWVNYKGKEYYIELGILDRDNLKPENSLTDNSNRVSVYFFDNISEIQSLLESIHELNYYVVKIGTNRMLLINSINENFIH